tara:strand:+ start:1415 stop:1966 length:552 start_codon:yes stop_codon:yes gene_type:complete
MSDETGKSLTKENLHAVLAEFMKAEKLDTNEVSEAIGCPEPVIGRILCGITWPTDELLKRCHTMFEIGYKTYKKLSESEKEKVSETLGTLGGAGLGVGASLAAVSALGTAGLSGAGIMSGLAALGTVIGGGAVAGIAVAAAIPIVVAAGGYLVIRGIKSGISKSQLKADEYDPHWERPVEEVI